MKTNQHTDHLRDRPPGLAAAALAALAAILLPSCINVEQDMWFDEDGGGRIVIDMGVSKQAMEMMQGLGEATGEAASAEELFEVDKARAALKEDDNVKSAKVTTRESKRYTHVVYDVVVKDITKFSDTQDSIFSQGPMAGGGPSPEGEFKVTRLDNGNYKLFAKLGGETPEDAGVGAAMMKEMLGDAGFTIRVHAKPVSDDHGGKLEGGAVVWSMPLVDLAGGKALEIDAEFAPGGSGGSSMALWVTLGTIVAVAAVVFFLLQSQKPKLA